MITLISSKKLGGCNNMRHTVAKKSGFRNLKQTHALSENSNVPFFDLGHDRFIAVINLEVAFTTADLKWKMGSKEKWVS